MGDDGVSWWDWLFGWRARKRIDPPKKELDRRDITVYIDPAVDESLVRSALKLIPGYWKFSVAEWDESQLTSLGGEWAGFLLPTQDNTVVVFDGKSRGVRYAGGTVGKRVGVAVFGRESELIIALRIWHELLHTEKLDADGMMTNRGFRDWLPGEVRAAFEEKARPHDWFWQIGYYTYLTETLVGRRR
ncbi:hypothetical protein [Geoglobus acetivorans]|uniref:Uncharacterized protein n=1 Tax=Geoglobus acetivorans TaxID=565033 RepID=A0ABZ3H1S9_GEOAI|nr:hypothetical protein [Geoglobus acetivorans]